DMFVAGNAESGSSSGTQTGSSNTESETVIRETIAPEPTEAPAEEKVKEQKIIFAASPEASEGVWTSSGSNWVFLVDGTPYSGGWLNDVDGKRYYFGEDGIMQTGMIETDGKQYYLDLDGIMQTGDVEVDGKTYHFLPDGSLQTEENPSVDMEALKAANVIATPTPLPGAAEIPVPTETPTPKATEAPAETPAPETSAPEITDAPTETATPEITDVPAETATPEITDVPAETSIPEITDVPAETSVPEITDTPAESPVPTATEAPTATPTPEPKQTRYLALTFDDGPGEYTDRLLDCLEANQAKATFFLTGNHISQYPDTVIRMDSLGYEIGNHSYTHPDYANLNQTDATAEVDGTNELLSTIIGRGASLFRPPYGYTADWVYSCSSLPLILWTSEFSAEESSGADAIADAVMAQAEDGSILMLHDTNGTTVEAAELFIPKFISEGYELLTVSELAEKNGISLQHGVAYESLKK
ncbi:MAG: polysaccharide deacetylase family protein, partial [Blautia sp.]|nr:polysaccharide deacetylase family protein [Blautia sp.]